MLTLAIWVAMALGGHVLWKAYGKWSKSREVPQTTARAEGMTYAVMPDIYNYASPEAARSPIFYIVTRTHSTPPDGSSGGYSLPEIANVMVIDPNGDGRWLFKGTQRTILVRDPVRQGPIPDRVPLGMVDSRPVIAVVMWGHEDTNRDGAYDDKDRMTAYVWRKGTKQAEPLFDFDEGVGLGQVSEDRYQIVYKTRGHTQVAIYSLPDFKFVADKALPDVPN